MKTATIKSVSGPWHFWFTTLWFFYAGFPLQFLFDLQVTKNVYFNERKYSCLWFGQKNHIEPNVWNSSNLIKSYIWIGINLQTKWWDHKVIAHNYHFIPLSTKNLTKIMKSAHFNEISNSFKFESNWTWKTLNQIDAKRAIKLHNKFLFIKWTITSL